MCQFASAFFKPSTMEVVVADLRSHGNTQEQLKLTDGTRPDGWREMHYTPTGEVTCRCLDGDTHTEKECGSAIRARWPTFIGFLSWALAQPTIDLGGYLALGGLTSAKGLVLPQSIGGSLALGGLTSAEGLVLPQSIGGYLYLGGLTSLPAGIPKGTHVWLKTGRVPA